jgi:hypothetical protein
MRPGHIGMSGNVVPISSRQAQTVQAISLRTAWNVEADHSFASDARSVVNEAHDRFLALVSRLIGLEYGPDGERLTTNAFWIFVCEGRSSIAGVLTNLGGDTAKAAAIIEEIGSLDLAVDRIAAAHGEAGRRDV